MSKVKQLSDELNVFYSRENNSGVGEMQYFTSSGALFLKDFGQEKVSLSIRSKLGSIFWGCTSNLI